MATITYAQYDGIMTAPVMKKTDRKVTYQNHDYYFYTYSVEQPFTPQSNPGFEDIEFMDVHGNKYSAADNIVCQKLDIGAFFSPEVSLTSPLSIDTVRANAALANEFGMAMIGDYYCGGVQYRFVSLDNDPFDPFDYEPLLNGTDGFTPWDILKPAGNNCMPFPAQFYGTGTSSHIHTVQSMVHSGSTVPEPMMLLKLNEPLFCYQWSSPTCPYLTRSILYAKPFLGSE